MLYLIFVVSETIMKQCCTRYTDLRVKTLNKVQYKLRCGLVNPLLYWTNEGDTVKKDAHLTVKFDIENVELHSLIYVITYVCM